MSRRDAVRHAHAIRVRCRAAAMGGRNGLYDCQTMTPPMHFRNFLGPSEWALCGEVTRREQDATLDPMRVTCESCLARLGRLRDHRIGIPGERESAEHDPSPADTDR